MLEEAIPSTFYCSAPRGPRNNAISWLQKRVAEKAGRLPRDFTSLADWESFRSHLREELPRVIGIPRFGPLQDSLVRGRILVGQDAICERVDVSVDADYAIPAFVFLPARPVSARLPALVWNPGWPEDKWAVAYQTFAVRMTQQGYAVLIPDHAPFGETSDFETKHNRGMTLLMGMGNVLGISQLALRAAETMRCGEYLRSRPDIDPARVAVAGLCQGGMDTWLTAALDEGFCAAAPICSETTFATHMTEMASYYANADASPFPFGVLNVCDIDHLHAAIAPRPLLVRANLPDEWWPVSGFAQVEALTRSVYRLYGAEDTIDFRAEVHEHNLTGPFADALEKFLLTYV
ncbi:MAG TPA: dienelactone hydrolase family protein [Chthonomonadales bacterium]|nr:dienelactone hydrolase family protein [Chthonomonadales bacterium]